MVIVSKASRWHVLKLEDPVQKADKLIALKMRSNLVESFLKLRMNEMYYWNKFSQGNQEENEIVRFFF